MNLHPFSRLCARPVAPSCCTSFLISRHPLHLPLKPMQGKIKGRGTTVRAKPCLHMGWRGTRSQRSRAVGDAGNPRESGVRDITIKEINAVSEHTP